MTTKQISLLTAFAVAHVEFAVVGGVAVNGYGYVRATHDLDLFLRPTPENAQWAFNALRALGVPLEGLEPNDLLNNEENLRFGPEEDHIDILASIGEMSFDQVWRNRMEIEIGGLAIPFISLDDLIANTQQVGRLRDLADVEELVLLKRGGRELDQVCTKIGDLMSSLAQLSRTVHHPQPGVETQLHHLRGLDPQIP